ncbi:hypothetical protein JRI60_51290 [Archangium violaceum]|uniref:hypothetical protein n=1 Tax=Archangium violaceum TaxID=83451 RepID=UPI00194E0288|nr:hypothetical protein [Archangium violaceum]QRN97243.1 hypothetical protein JRI60_51290 [Archangium violaceum]
MRLPAFLPSCLASVALLAAVLVAPPARARPLLDVHEGTLAARDRGIPVALHLLPADMGVESPSLPVIDPALEAEAPEMEPHVSTRPNLKADAPVTTGAWVMYGTSALVPLGGIYGASRLGGERLWVTGLETVAGSVVGSVPGSMLFLQPANAGGRWTELDVAAFGVGLVLTPPVAALGTWGLGELAFDGSRERGRAFLGALGGAAAGTLLGVVMHGALEEVVGNTDTLMALRKYIALGFIGSGATLGYQWAGGGPRQRSR